MTTWLPQLNRSKPQQTMGHRRISVQTMRFVLIAAAYVIAIGLSWELLIHLFRIPNYVLPRPTSVLLSLSHLPNYYALHAWLTAQEAGLGILIGFSAGFIIGMVLRYGGWFGRLVSPLVVASQVFPKEALAPLFLIYFGFGMLPKVVISALICFFPVAINTYEGLKATSEQHVRLFHVLGASPWQKFWRCSLPFAVRYVSASGRVCAVLGLIGAVVGEFVGASGGLGYVIRSATSDIGTERVFAALILLGLIGAAFYGVALFIDRVLLKRFTQII
jgi:NitT/TauT family transport system permease protein